MDSFFFHPRLYKKIFDSKLALNQWVLHFVSVKKKYKRLRSKNEIEK